MLLCRAGLADQAGFDVSFDKRVEALGLRYALRPSRQFGGVVTVDVDDALQYAPRLQ
jgi:hypothetical protein